MDISEQSDIFHLLRTKGYTLQESTPERLRFEKQDDDHSEIIIQNIPGSLPVQIKTKGETVDYSAENFADLKNYLEETL